MTLLAVDHVYNLVSDSGLFVQEEKSLEKKLFVKNLFLDTKDRCC